MVESDGPVSLHQLSLAPWGFRMGFRSDDARALELVRALFLPDWTEEKLESFDQLYSLWQGGSSPGLYKDGELIGDGDAESMVRRVERDLHIDIATYAPEWVFVHAGVVRWKDRAIVVPGRSYAGKSTLVQALVERGAVYYSDEYAVFDKEGLVHAYPRPISLREPVRSPQRRPAAELGWTPQCGPIPTAMVVVTAYEKGAQWKPVTLSPGKTVLALFDNTVSAQIAPARAMQVLPRVALSAERLEGARGEAGDTANRILDRLS